MAFHAAETRRRLRPRRRVSAVRRDHGYVNRTTLAVVLAVLAAVCALVAAAKDFGWLDQEPLHEVGFLALAVFFAVLAWLATIAPPPRQP